MGSQKLGGETVDAAISGGQFEELVDELNSTPTSVPLTHRTCPFRIMFIAS
jgi:hypothetical protein